MRGRPEARRRSFTAPTTSVVRGLIAAVEEDGADQRFGDIAENGAIAPPPALRLARAEADMVAEAPDFRELGAALAPHELGEALREVALIGRRELPVEKRGDHEAEHAIAEELEPLIAFDARAGTRNRAHMRQGEGEKLLVAEAIADERLERLRRCRSTLHAPNAPII